MENREAFVKNLEERMSRADWYYDYSDDYTVRRRAGAEIEKIKDDLKELSTSTDGKNIAAQLWNKHAPGDMTRPDYLPFVETSKITLTDKEINYIQQQFKNIGADMHFTPELIDRLKKGEEKIEHPGKLENNGDNAGIVYHISKGKDSNLYYLNKYEMTVQKENHNSEVKQTFYVSGQDNVKLKEGEEKLKNVNRFTIKKAANYLAGRPVFNAFSTKDGDQYEAWARIDFKRVKSNGEFEMIKYRKEYPFNLDDAAKKYSIKELGTPEYKERLFDSYKRGNLQSVTFVGENGREEKLYTSPQIGLVEGGSLNIYDLNKDKVPVQVLLDKGYIGNDLAEKIKHRYSEKQEAAKQLVEQKKTLKETPPKKVLRNKIS